MYLCLYVYKSQWLEKDFLAYLDEWQTSVASRTELTASAKNKLCLSLETLEGLRITGNWIIRGLYKYKFTEM